MITSSTISTNAPNRSSTNDSEIAKVVRVAGRLFTTFRRVPAAIHHNTEIHAVNEINCQQPVLHLLRLYVKSTSTDRFVFNGDASLITLACLLKWLLPGQRGRIIAVDLVLRVPKSRKARLAAWLRRLLWRQVDHFIHYFRNIDGYTRHYGIRPQKSSYLPFKSNLIDQSRIEEPLSETVDGDYIFSAGRSLRDYQTLIEAARISGLPVALLFTSKEEWAAHGTFVDTDSLPANVRLITDNGSPQGWLKGLQGARIVAIPTRPESICASGIGTYLDAMALKKPVVITRGPGADDVLTDAQALFVPPNDPDALARALRSVWDNPIKAQLLAERGHDYALSLGDEQALLQRVFHRSLSTS